MLLYSTNIWHCFGKIKKLKYQARQSRLGGTARQWLLYPTQTMFVGGILFSRCPSIHVSIHPSMMFCFFLNILKRQWWKFIKLCRHIDIDKMYVYNRKLRANSVEVIAVCNSKWCIGSDIRGIQHVPQLFWNILILCIHNVDTLNICMKKFDVIKILHDKKTAFWT